jgi:hypothetical protein
MIQHILKKQYQRKSRVHHGLRRKEFLSYQKTKKKTRRAEKKTSPQTPEIFTPVAATTLYPVPKTQNCFIA